MNLVQKFIQVKGHGASTPWRLVLLNLASFTVLCVIAFQRNKPFLFYALDGNYMRLLVKEQWVWKGLEFGFSGNFFQSLGNVWFPVNAQLIPGYFISALTHGGAVDPVLSYTIFAVELFIATLFLARRINLTWTIAVLSAWLFPLVVYPFYAPPAIYPIMPLIPHLGTEIAVTMVMIILFFEIGKRDLANAAWLTGGIALLAIYMAVSQPANMILIMPAVAIFGLAALASAESRSERNAKLLCISAVTLLLLLTGTLQYLYGLLKYTAVNFFPGDFFDDRRHLSFVSTLFHEKGRKGLLILGCMGAFTMSIWGDGIGKAVARATLFCTIAIVGFGLITTRFDFWRGPSALYFEFVLWPFFAAFAMTFLFLTGAVAVGFLARVRNIKIFSKTSNTQTIALVLAAMVAWPAVIFAHTRVRDMTLEYPSAPYPPPRTAIVDILEREIGLSPGKEFRGRVVTLTGQTLLQSVGWLDLVRLDHQIIQELGNDHRAVGLWYYDIPTLFEYNSFITPAFHQFAKSFLSQPGDGQMRSVVTLRHAEPRLLAAIGVRFVILDREANYGRLRSKISIGELGNLYLYELDSPNIGQFSPRKAIRPASAGDAIDMLSRKDFDPAEELVTESALPSDLTRADSAHLLVERGRLRISATSAGTSVLLLPLEFSRCLNLVSNRGSAAKQRLFRVNLVQAAILFDRELDAFIRYSTGPLQNSTCRLDDAGEYKQLLVGRNN